MKANHRSLAARQSHQGIARDKVLIEADHIAFRIGEAGNSYSCQVIIAWCKCEADALLLQSCIGSIHIRNAEMDLAIALRHDIGWRNSAGDIWPGRPVNLSQTEPEPRNVDPDDLYARRSCALRDPKAKRLHIPCGQAISIGDRYLDMMDCQFTQRWRDCG